MQCLLWCSLSSCLFIFSFSLFVVFTYFCPFTLFLIFLCLLYFIFLFTFSFFSLILFFFFFFFFKQKTAYEMRISDWSSDVCSSDLCFDQLRGQLVHRRALALDDLRDRLDRVVRAFRRGDEREQFGLGAGDDAAALADARVEPGKRLGQRLVDFACRRRARAQQVFGGADYASRGIFAAPHRVRHPVRQPSPPAGPAP